MVDRGHRVGDRKGIPIEKEEDVVGAADFSDLGG